MYTSKDTVLCNLYFFLQHSPYNNQNAILQILVNKTRSTLDSRSSAITINIDMSNHIKHTIKNIKLIFISTDRLDLTFPNAPDKSISISTACKY